ncbi:hypothetical protein FQZ97_709240 [compost metagenome]
MDLVALIAVQRYLAGLEAGQAVATVGAGDHHAMGAMAADRQHQRLGAGVRPVGVAVGLPVLDVVQHLVSQQAELQGLHLGGIVDQGDHGARHQMGETPTDRAKNPVTQLHRWPPARVARPGRRPRAA